MNLSLLGDPMSKIQISKKYTTEKEFKLKKKNLEHMALNVLLGSIFGYKIFKLKKL